LNKSLLLTGSLAALLLLLELGFRMLEGPLGVSREQVRRVRRIVLGDESARSFAPRPHTLYVRQPADPRVNDLGFFGGDFRRDKRPGVPRIACLGSSTTEGGNALDHAGSYPHFLAEILRQRVGSEIEVLNFGISGWTSAETLLNYLLVVQDFTPDIVLVHEAVNDADPRAWPGFRNDYSHYRKPWRAEELSWGYRLLVRLSDAFVYRELSQDPEVADDIPVSREPAGPFTFSDGKLPSGTEYPFLRNVRTIVEHVGLRGGHTVLVTMPYDLSQTDQGMAAYRAGLDEHNAILRELARRQNAMLVDLDAQARERFQRLKPFFLDLVHVTPEGNRWKAAAIADALLAGKLL
jgi:lysophospholipase L1-like esterase